MVESDAPTVESATCITYSCRKKACRENTIYPSRVSSHTYPLPLRIVEEVAEEAGRRVRVDREQQRVGVLERRRKLDLQ